jgi:hypothetical protein
MIGTRVAAVWTAATAALWLGVGQAAQSQAAETQPADPLVSAYVVLGPGGEPVVRAITTADACPAVTVDGVRRPMRVRAAPETLPLRPTASTLANSKPSAFPALTCEAQLPARAKAASVAGQPLPLPKANARRIVVIGDTGCRLKASDKAYQACNDPAAYPFAKVAARAAAWKPDLVVHVGDQVYRENPCVEGHDGCAGSPWGYGLDAWRADFLDPARPLLKAAPWVITRGNHENCARAGQGWWRLMDPRPLQPGRDCIDPANDVTGDYSPPYAVPLGGGAQIVNMDLSHAGDRALSPDDPRIAQFRETYDALAVFAPGARQTFALDHYPILGISAGQKDGVVTLRPGNQAIQSAFGADGRPMLPKGVDVLLAGHVHLWEQVSFAKDFPSQFIAGFSGTQEDIVPLPAKVPAGMQPAPGAQVERFSSWIDGFGWMTLERGKGLRWKVTVWSAEGQVMNRCLIVGRTSKCEKSSVTNPG